MPTSPALHRTTCDRPADRPVAIRRSRAGERASSAVEYVGLGALSAMLVTGIAAAVDSAAGDRLAATVVKRLLAAISGSE